MADEDVKKVEEPVEEQPKEETPEEQPQEAPSEPETPEEPEESESSQPLVEEEAPSEEPQPMSRRKAKRLEKLEGLVERLKGQEQPKPKSDGIDYRKMIDADDQVYEELDKASKDFGQQQYNQGLEQAKSIQFHTRLEIDAPRIEAKYPIFDKTSPDFNPAIADNLNQMFLATVGYDPKTDTVRNPNLRYADFIDGLMELSDNMAGQRTTESTQNIAKQAASTGLRPNGESVKPLNLNKSPEDMTDEELKASIKASMPRNSQGQFTSRTT